MIRSKDVFYTSCDELCVKTAQAAGFTVGELTYMGFSMADAKLIRVNTDEVCYLIDKFAVDVDGLLTRSFSYIVNHTGVLKDVATGTNLAAGYVLSTFLVV